MALSPVKASTSNIRDDDHILPDELQETSLLYLLSNHLLLCQVAPYLSIASLLGLGATSRAFHALIHETPGVFRYLDLTTVRSVRLPATIGAIDRGGQTWRNVQLDENLTEDDFYSGPLRGALSAIKRRGFLWSVQILVLDGLSVTSDVCHEILTDDTYNVRILSLRGCQNLNHRLLRGALEYACRPSRREGMPRLKGLYIFGARDESGGTNEQVEGRLPFLRSTARIGAVGSSASRPSLVAPEPEVTASPRSVLALEKSTGLGDEWWSRRGQMLPGRNLSGWTSAWASTLLACRGIIVFDAVLCNGPRHVNSPVYGKISVPAATRSTPYSQWEVATYALDPCSGCGGAPEGVTTWHSPQLGPGLRRCTTGDGDRLQEGRYPLLAPPPLHSGNLQAAMCPNFQSDASRPGEEASASSAPKFIARCTSCLRERFCSSCFRWWCEECYLAPPTFDRIAAGQAERQHGVKIGVSPSCWGCGFNCHDCIARTQRVCQNCGGGYCIIHNEGSSLTMCEWCRRRGRRRRVSEFY